MVAVSKGREVCCRRDELTSLWGVPGQSIGLTHKINTAPGEVTEILF